MEKNSRIPLPGGYGFHLITEEPEFKDYAPPFRGSYVLVDPSGKHIRQMADYQALPFAAAMQPQPTQSAPWAIHAKTITAYKAAYSAMAELCYCMLENVPDDDCDAEFDRVEAELKTDLAALANKEKSHG